MEERMSWHEIVKKYPDMWVCMKDYVYIKGRIVDTSVICVCNDDEVDDKMVEIGVKDRVLWARTTEIFQVI